MRGAIRGAGRHGRQAGRQAGGQAGRAKRQTVNGTADLRPGHAVGELSIDHLSVGSCRPPDSLPGQTQIALMQEGDRERTIAATRMNSSRDPVAGNPQRPQEPIPSVPGLLPWPCCCPAAALLACCPPLAGIDRLQSWPGLTHLPGTSDWGGRGQGAEGAARTRAGQAVTTQAGGEGRGGWPEDEQGRLKAGQPDQCRPAPSLFPPTLDPKLKSVSTSTSTSPTREGPRPKPKDSTVRV